MDETPLQELNEPGRAAQSKSYMWVLATTQASVPIVLYDYSASRGSEVPGTLLPDFSGALNGRWLQRLRRGMCQQ